ncbi:MAG: hypothetical protein ACOZAR_01940 [Patescibacteria group bacterium]
MKKTIPFFLFSLLLLSLIGCTNPASKTTDNPIKKTTNNSQKEENNQEVATGNNTVVKNEESKQNATNNDNQSKQKYENADLGISLEYPTQVALIDQNTTPSLDQKSLKIETKEIGKTQSPSDLDAADEMKNIEALASGSYGFDIDWPLTPSKKVRPVGFLFAQDFLVLSRFDVCNVTLERKLLFYHNNQQIVITLYAPIDKLKTTMSDYFTTDSTNCSTEKIWNFDQQEKFYNQLVAGTASPEIQKWYSDFDQISESVIFAGR